MNLIRVLYHLMKADFLERVRRPSFLFMLLFSVALTYFFIPAMDAPVYAHLVLGGYRPVYNSAWIGTAVTLLMGEFFLLFGFYLVKNAIEHDRRSGVGEIIATTPISKATYLLGKWLSNLAVLGSMIAAMTLAALLLQLLRGEDLHIRVWALASPLLLVLLPSLALVAALAVLFESINWLRGGLGNVVYFFAYGLLAVLSDFQGRSVLWPSVYQACARHFAHCNPSRQIDIDAAPLSYLTTFTYEGITWTGSMLLPRLGFVLAGLAVVLLTALFFHRFDPARAGKNTPGSLLERLKEALIAFVVQPAESDDEPLDVFSTAQASARPITLSPVAMNEQPASLYRQVLLAEMRLAFKGVSWLWYLVALGLIAATWIVELPMAHLIVLPLAWLWPLFRWSGMGSREVHYRTHQIVFSGPHPLRQQFAATWLVGFLVALGMGSGVALRLALSGDWAALLSVLVGAAFLPSLALVFGCWSGGSRLFEAFYLFLWYLVAIQNVPFLDFMGRFPEMIAAGIPWLYMAATLLLLGAALAGRQRQMRL
ncbi:MAG: hypothetical protein AB1894_19325 [Chloroflexota bacterium]